ncbi:hypothetical protein GH714_038414 [Hevea brasiliensis]|uniref:Protein EARLY FLOWERING 4 domain-containing protein n=1 Tax=Hevea brasiliensis TaxID=3981 RepID=A0A6A6KFR5_HEVBR|nr:hypothetical protein GH714_038414 [Hevea brasiliensis]
MEVMISTTDSCLICTKTPQTNPRLLMFLSGGFVRTLDSPRKRRVIGKMEGDTFSGLGNGTQIDGKILQTFQKNFVQVQNILDQNRLLINEINQNHESKIPGNLGRNVGLIRELNNNIRRVVDLYADLSSSFTKSMEVSSEGDSSGALKSDAKAGHKRNRPT